ncbi:interferon gamma receptor 2 [Thalassophryne amazonica]|uniref:interferon gamma receptor 2 n=1 Tax=Thalassophryne amazonica TaxID=390379 RepID=UPI0014717A31|nr:interferon gamma receptor 2 [Thalassophryne amazonica]
MKFFILVFLQVVGKALSAVAPEPPQDIFIKNWLLTWTPPTEQEDVTYTVQYRSFNTAKWINVSTCLHTRLTSCDITATKSAADYFCIMLRVQAERQGLTSKAVEACSNQGDSCSPEFSLTARPGALTVHLSRNHSLALEHADHAQHRVYYGKEGQQLKKHIDAASSVTIPEMEEGQRYCVKVQHLLHGRSIGPPSCIQCEIIPASKNNQTVITVVVVVVVVVLLIPSLAFLIIFQQKRFKQCLRPPFEMPESIREPLPHNYCVMAAGSPEEERYDRLSFVVQEL